MSLVSQWRAIEAELPERWGEAKVSLTLADESRRPRAAALLAPLAPGRSGDSFRFSAVRMRAGASSGALARALGRLDEERIGGELALLATDDVQAAATAPRATATGAWEAELARLPSDWSDAWVELRFRSSDVVERAALLCAPLNPARTPDGFGLRFRAARTAGYGAPPAMVSRCMSRLDEEEAQVTVTVLRALSETTHVYTQGPVWYVEGKVVQTLVGDPVSYLLIEEAWDVVGSDGERVGGVREVLADMAADIFDGLTVDSGLTHRLRYVAAERIAQIEEGRVILDAPSDAWDEFPVWEGSPPSGDAA